jgi:hypothetical protein
MPSFLETVVEPMLAVFLGVQLPLKRINRKDMMSQIFPLHLDTVDSGNLVILSPLAWRAFYRLLEQTSEVLKTSEVFA